MKIKFIGAVGGQVTGSCTLCYANTGTMFLVDCGVFQGGLNPEVDNRGFPFDPRKIKFVLLTHAHADHCGRIPDLYKCGFNGKVICTEETMKLAIENFNDAEKFKNQPPLPNEKWEEKFLTPENGLHHFKKPCIPFPIDNNLSLTFYRSSHLLGAMSIAISWKTISFSGDLGCPIDLKNSDENHLTFLKDAHVPHNNTDYLVVESTYGAAPERESDKQNFNERIKQLKKVVTNPDINTFVFACFAMQRTQDILFDLLYVFKQNLLNKKYTIVLDSPMGIRVCKIYKEALCKSMPNQPNKRMNRNSCFAKRFTEGNEEQADEFIKKVLDNADENSGYQEKNISIRWGSKGIKNIPPNEKMIYITSSGMFVGGPVIQHLIDRHEDHKTAFILTGYQASVGKKLAEWAELNPNERTGSLILDYRQEKTEILAGEMKATINKDICAYYSGHADVRGTLNHIFWSAKLKEANHEATVIINHGTPEARHTFKQKIEYENENRKEKMRNVARVILPDADSPFFDLDTGRWDEHFAQAFYRNHYEEDFDAQKEHPNNSKNGVIPQ